MAILGTRERPAVVRVGTLERSSLVMALCQGRGWQVIVGVEPDKPEDLTDLELLAAAERPRLKVGRNEPCPCGSGKKHKKCCEKAPSAAARLLEEWERGGKGERSLLDDVKPFHERHSPCARELDALWGWLDYQPWASGELKRAAAELLGGRPVPSDGDLRSHLAARLTEWFFFDRPLSAGLPGAGAPVVAAWSAGKETPLARTIVGAFRVEGVTRPHHATITRLADQQSYRLVDLELAQTLEPGNYVVGRLYPQSGSWVPGYQLAVLKPKREDRAEIEATFPAIRDGLSFERLLIQGVQ